MNLKDLELIPFEVDELDEPVKELGDLELIDYCNSNNEVYTSSDEVEYDDVVEALLSSGFLDIKQVKVKTPFRIRGIGFIMFYDWIQFQSKQDPSVTAAVLINHDGTSGGTCMLYTNTSDLGLNT